MTNKELSDELGKLRSDLNKISSKLHSHLDVAEFVDKSSKEDIKEITRDLRKTIARVVVVETDIVLIKRDKRSKKELFIFIVKIITLICVVIGAVYTLTKTGTLNATGSG